MNLSTPVVVLSVMALSSGLTPRPTAAAPRERGDREAVGQARPRGEGAHSGRRGDEGREVRGSSEGRREVPLAGREERRSGARSREEGRRPGRDAVRVDRRERGDDRRNDRGRDRAWARGDDRRHNGSAGWQRDTRRDSRDDRRRDEWRDGWRDGRREGRHDRRRDGRYDGRYNGWNGWRDGRGGWHREWQYRDRYRPYRIYRPYRVPRYYGPGGHLSIYFGLGSGYRYGSFYTGRVYGYAPPAVAYGVHRYYGDVRLRVRPRHAQVYVDGYYAGIVDDFDGVFQRLTLEVGPHQIELDAPGLEPQVFDIYVDPERTLELRADLYPWR